MARLSARTKKREPSSAYGLPDKKKYPMPDKAHAANAEARATQMKKAGKLSAADAAKVKAKAKKVLKATGAKTVAGKTKTAKRK